MGSDDAGRGWSRDEEVEDTMVCASEGVVDKGTPAVDQNEAGVDEDGERRLEAMLSGGSKLGVDAREIAAESE